MSTSDLTITVNRGANYAPSERLSRVLAEVDAVLREEHGDDVAGFRETGSGMATGRRQYEPLLSGPGASSVFHTITWTVVSGNVAVQIDGQPA